MTEAAYYLTMNTMQNAVRNKAKITTL